MKMVSWDKVAKGVACNRSGRVYKRAVQRVLEGWVEELDGEVGTVKGDDVIVVGEGCMQAREKG